MANEIQCSLASGRTIYAIIRGLSNNIGLVWRSDTNVWESYLTVNYLSYKVALTEQGTASGFYTGNFPSAISAGSYSVVVKQQIAGTAAETDPTVAAGNIDWNGSYPAPLSDTATSGLVGQFLPMRLYRRSMIKNFPFKLVSSSDHVTPFVSGIVSGQISKDGGAFGALQSGAYVELGLGWYSLQAITSGDADCNTAALSFSAVVAGGGSSDQRDMAIIFQRSSGVA